MKWVRYSRYTGEDFGIDADDLLRKRCPISSCKAGSTAQYMQFNEWNQQTLEDLKNAIQKALEQGNLFDDDSLQEMMQRLQDMTAEQKNQLLDRLVRKMVDEGHITVEEPGDPAAPGDRQRA